MLRQAVKKTFLAAVITLSVLAAYISIRWAIADILETQIRYQLSKAQTVHHTLDAREWRLTHDMLKKTLELHPDYSGYLELAAFFYRVAASRSQALVDELGWHDSQQQALEYARSALQKRPSWPYLWDDLFQSKVRLKQFDNELTGAMERAVTLGPWEEPVQYDIAFDGLDEWDNLPTEARQTVLKAMEQNLAMLKNPKSLYEDIEEYANIDKLCQLANLAADPTLSLLKQYCRQAPESLKVR
ncbi:MAG: hypothetical protein ACU88J_11665 [Gammaproteobacteria bacterium]